MPIIAHIEPNPGNPAAISVHLTAADGTVTPVRNHPCKQLRQTMLPELTTGPSPEKLSEGLARIRSGSPGAGDVPIIGKYLHDVLFGPHDWRKGTTSAGKEPIELILQIADSPALRLLHNLPWESLHDGSTFLAVADPHPLAVVRCCGPGETNIRLNPRVLFVVGDDLSENKLQPGAEYYSVLRRLEADGTFLHTRILLRASLSRLTREISEFDPAIIHMVCHGAVGSTGGYLMMYDDKDLPGFQAYAVPLVKALRDGLKPAQSLPVVVLTACDTALLPNTMDLRDPTRSLAEDLVRNGVPLVVGMSGRVSARACRLFAREFYAAVARAGTGAGALLTQAASRGRYWAIVEQGGKTDLSIDWAMPAMFRRETEVVSVEKTQYEDFAERVTFAKSFRTLTDPPLICDRVEGYLAYRRLMRGEPGAILAVRLTVQDARGRKDAKFGLSRQLEELAHAAALDGHVPCLARKFEGSRILLLRILQGIDETRKKLGIARDLGTGEVDKLQQRIDGDLAVKLAPEVEKQINLNRTFSGQPDPTHTNALRAAVELDLRKLAADAKLDETRRVILLIEDLHYYNQTGIDLATNWLSGQFGLASSGVPIPLILGYCTIDRDENKGVPGAIDSQIEEKKAYVGRVDLDLFPHVGQDSLPYLQLLLGLRPFPMVICPSVADKPRQSLLEKIAEKTERIPSLFSLARNVRLDEVIQMLSTKQDFWPPNQEPLLIVADDEAFMQKHAS